MKTHLFLAAALFCSCTLTTLADEGSTKTRDAGRLFKIYDANGNGSISLEEYKAGQGDNMSPDRLPKVFAEKDRNHDGKLSMEEFLYIPVDQRPATPAPAVKDSKKSKR